MRYKNIIFDFGNVIGKFKGDYILGKFASTPEDYNILADAIFKNWVALDARSICFPTLLPGLQNVHRKIIRS